MTNLNWLYEFAQALYTAGSLAMFYSAIDNLLLKRKMIPKKQGISVDISGLESILPDITVMVPAYKEQKVIGNTVDRIASLHYPANKFNALFLVDEKEDIAKKEDSRITIALATDIIKKGGFVYENLYNRMKEKNPKFSDKGLRIASDGYITNAYLLVMSFLRKHYGTMGRIEGESEKRVVTNSFSILSNVGTDQEQDGQLEKLVNNSFHFLTNVDSFSREALLRELLDIYNNTDMFNTTKDEVKKRIDEKYSGKDTPTIDFAVVPNTFDGEYQGKILNRVVPSSKGRALNFGLGVIDEKYPQTRVIGIFDADGRPHKEVLAYVAKESLSIPEGKDFFSQGPIYLVRNFNEVDWVCKHSGLSGTLWHRVLYPAKVMKSNKPGVNKITHFSGTNYFFTKRIVEKVGGWPPFHPTEDLGIAYKVYMNYLKGNIEKPIVTAHPYEEIEQTTQSFSVWFRQQYRWASGYKYQAGEVMRSDLPVRHKLSLVSKLFEAPLMSSIAFTAGVSGLSLLAATALGYGQTSEYSHGLNEFMKTTMALGFAGFMSIQTGIYLWSLKNKYIPYTNAKDIAKNILQITATNIPYSILATVPTLISWVRGLKGWGVKTPRTEERIASREQNYFKEISSELPSINTPSSFSWYKKLYGRHFNEAEEKGLTEIILTKRAAVDYTALNLRMKRPSPFSIEYSDIVTQNDLFDSFYKFKREGKIWVLSGKA